MLIKKIITINRVEEEVSKGHPEIASYTSNSTQKTWKKETKAQTLTKASAFIHEQQQPLVYQHFDH